MTNGFGKYGLLYKRRSPDDPPATPHALDDEFNDTVLNTKWSWVNQGAATATLETGRLIGYAPCAGGGQNHRLLKQTAPAGDFIATCKMEVDGFPKNYAGSGIYLRNSSNGKLLSCSKQLRATYIGMAIYRWNSPTSWNSEVLFVWGADFKYFRIQKSGTNINYYASADGYGWVLLGTDAISSFIGTVNEVGIGFDNEYPSGDYYSSFEWFRVTE